MNDDYVLSFHEEKKMSSQLAMDENNFMILNYLCLETF